MSWDYELFIDGKWTSEGAEGSIDVIDPATEDVIGSVPERHHEAPPYAPSKRRAPGLR